MAKTSRFGVKRPFIKTSGNGLVEENFMTLSGLNLYAPDELSQDNESPFARNFRIFQADSEEARVAISKRKGHRSYSIPVGETERGKIDAITGAADQPITTVGWFAQPFTVSAAGRLTKLSLNLKNDNTGTSPLIVKIYTDVAGVPGALLATSSIANSDIAATYGYLEAKFIEAPVVATSTTYWIVTHLQSEGTNDYKISSTTSATTALTSNTSGNTWSASTFALNYKVYVSTDKSVKGIYRYYRTTTAPVTLFVHDTVLYSVSDVTGATTSVGTGLNAAADTYRFITVEDIVYFTNELDNVKKYNGTTMADMGGSPGIGIDICLHVSKIFILKADNSVIWSIEDISSYEVFETDALQYIPTPKSGDKAFAMQPFQDNLVFFTKNTKWVLYGYDRATIQIRESTATKGAVGINAICRDENVIYFVSDDNDVYAFNGGTDKSLGIKVSRLIENIANKKSIHMVVHNGLLRIYYIPTGQSSSQNCLIYDLMYEQWLLDTEIYTGIPYVFNSQTDSQVLVHGSSLVGALYYGEYGTSDIGKPIIFDYWTKYYSFKHPSRKHRIKRLYPFINPGDGPYYCDVQTDVDESNSPTSHLVLLAPLGSAWGSGTLWGSSSVWGGTALKPKRISIPGQARKHQVRFIQHGVDNPVEIKGFTTYTRIRRPI